MSHGVVKRFIPSLEQLKEEEEFPSHPPSEVVCAIVVESQISEDTGYEQDIFWYAFWYFIKEYYL